MAVDIAELGLKVRSDGVVTATDRLDKMGRAAGRAETATERLSKVAANVGRALAVAGAAGGTAMAAFTANSIRLGIAAEETASKFQTVFRGSVEATDRALINLTKTVPLTISEMRGLASGVQDMLVPMGLAREDAAGLSVEAVKLAADLASFNDTDADIVLQNIQSALAGSSEPLRKFGIDVRETALQTVALEEGIIGVGESMTQAQRAQAVFAAITRDSADAIGDLERTADSTANRMRNLRTNFRQIQEDLGTALLPAFNELLGILVSVGEDGFSPMQRILQSLATGIIDGAIALVEFRMAWNNLAADVDGAMEKLAEVTDWFTSLDEKAYESGASVRNFIADMVTSAGGDEIGEAIRGGISGAFDDAVDEDWLDIDSLIRELEGQISNINLSKLVSQLEDAKSRIEKGVRDPLKESSNAAANIGKTVDKIVIPALKKMSDIVSKELQDSFAFLEAQEGFRSQAEAMQAEIDALNGGTEAWREYNKQLFIAAEVGKLQGDVTDEQRDKIAGLADKLFEARDGFSGLVEQSVTLGDTLGAVGGAFEDVITSIQGGVKRGSDEYKKLEIAVQATNIVQAIGAILNQAQGDPYTAVPRMAAMASIVASLVGTAFSISGLSGGAADPTADRQASLGTGTVLGDSEAKSESIVRSLEITASATSELVGINRGMLRALTNLTDAISGASNLLSGSLGNVDFGEIVQPDNIFADIEKLFLGVNFLAKSFLGGSAKIADTGISIAGGNLSQLLEGALISAFQDVAVKKNIFDDTDIERSLVDLDDAVTNQFSLVFQALVDTVSTAATALGYSAEEIQEGLDRFIIYAQDISFEDMNAEEQQAALEAYFSSIFDRLAHEVVRFIDEFQKVGEGMGETLIRVATSVQVFEEALKQLSFRANFVNTKQWATIAVNLVEATGGIEAFIQGLDAFTKAFVSEEQQFANLGRNLSSAFGELNMQLPESRDQVLALLQAQSAETQEGADRIALLLELAPLLDEYYTQLEKQRQALSDFIGLGPSSAITNLEKRFAEAIKAADALGASQAEYAMIVRAFDRQLAVMTAQMTKRLIQTAQQLFNDDGNAFADGVNSGVDSVRKVTNSLFTDWERALKGISDFTKGVLLDESLTPLNPAEQFAEAQSQFNDLLARARAGDLDAANALPDAAQAFLEEARFMFASGEEYQRIFDQVMADLEGIQRPAGIEEYTIEIANNTADTVAAVNSMQNQMIARLDRLIMANDLANQLRELSFALDKSPIEIAQELGIPLDRLVSELGVDLAAMNADTVYGLFSVAELIGADLGDLGTALGIDIMGLADELGIDLSLLEVTNALYREIDYLDSINQQTTRTANLLEYALYGTAPADPGLFPPRDPEEPVYGPVAPSNLSATEPSATNDPDIMEEVVTVLTEIRDDNAASLKEVKDIYTSIDAGITNTADALRKIA